METLAKFKSPKEISNQGQIKHIKIENTDGLSKTNNALDNILIEESTTPSGVNAKPNSKFVLKGQPLQIFTQEKVISGTKSALPKHANAPLIAHSSSPFSNSSASQSKAPPTINFQNNITLSPVKGGFKIPISPLKNFKNPLRLSIISNPNANASKSVNVEASTSGSSRLTNQNTSNFQFQTLVPPQSNRISNNPQGTTQTINIQPQLSSGRFQCLRLVSAANSQQSSANAGLPIANLVPAQHVSTPVRTTIVQQQPQPIQHYVNVPTVQKPLGQPPAKTQRLIMPAAPQNQTAGSNLSPGSVLQAGNVGYAMVPAKYVEQLKKQLNNQLFQVLKSESSDVATDVNSNSTAATSLSKTVANGKVRKPCNCTKSMCLKLYCECFANGHFCDGCNCINCHNNVEFDADRSKAIKSCLERNPLAFKPKIGRGGDDSRTHQKGCNCKRSGCLKNYCECYEARIPCTSKCKCIGCKNIEEDATAGSDQHSLMNLADAAAVRCQQQAAARSRINSQLKDMRSSRLKPQSHTSSGERLPCMFFTQEVIEATCTCMLAQAEEAEKTNRSIQVAETMILEEFGRCLMQIIQAASKTKTPS